MKSHVKSCIVVIFAVAVGALGSYFLFRDVESEMPGTRVVKTKTIGGVKKVTEISIVENNGKKAVKIVESEQIRPGSLEPVPGVAANSQPDDIDEEELTELQKSVLKELQDALDNNNLKQVRKALSKFVAKAKNGGLGGQVPACMRSRAVAALGWFGKDAAVDLIGYVADPCEEVATDASMQFEQALSDTDMGDFERAEILVAAMQAITDEDQVNSLLCQLDNMRNSVKAQAAEDILSTGTDTAQSKMAEQLEFYFDEEVADSSGIEKWKAMNPDDPDDNETYGGSNPESNQAPGLSAGASGAAVKK